ncbi:MAG: hypothetical protein NTV65_01920 [Proteobacteria bacterium]|nr:hypothetical protein [Pseudomonadota bacterium]
MNKATRGVLLFAFLIASTTQSAQAQQCDASTQKTLIGCLASAADSCLSNVTACTDADASEENIILGLKDRLVASCCSKSTLTKKQACLNKQQFLLKASRSFLGSTVVFSLNKTVKALLSSLKSGGNCESSSPPFFITAVQFSPVVEVNGNREDITVTYQGSPKFPVSLVYDLNPVYGRSEGSTTCAPYLPSYFNCITVSQEFTTAPTNKRLTLSGAQYCDGSPGFDVYFDYVVYLRDADGVETPVEPAPFTCNVP